MGNQFAKNFLVVIVVLIVVFLITFIFSFFAISYYRENAVALLESLEPLVAEKTPEEIAIEEEERRRIEQERIREERRLREELRKEELGVFYVPLPPIEIGDNSRVKAKGIFVTGNTAGSPSRFNVLLDLVTATELNAMVIDVKNDNGLMTYKSEIEIVKNVGANRSMPIKDIENLMAQLEERDIYPIARIVVFKDPFLAEQKTEWAIQKKEGGIWRDNRGVPWINPHEKQVWDYNIAIAREAALMGFREIQFDYVRFPENAARVDREAYYPGEDGVAKDEAIENFLIYAREQLEEYNVYIAADTFGVIATSWGDHDRIGQSWERIAPIVDYNCPMIYPSHYGPGYFGFAVPDANPAGTVTRALSDAVKRNAPIENPAIIRPWLQSFTATWIKGYINYGANEIRAQIDAALELGIDEYLIWNSSNRYIESAFMTEAEAVQREEKSEVARREKGQDVLSRNTQDALDLFMTAVQYSNWRDAFVLHSTGFSMNHQQYEEWVKGWIGRLVSYNIISDYRSENKQIYECDFVIRVDNEDIIFTAERFEVYKENNIWRVNPPQSFVDTLTMISGEDETEELSANDI